MGRFARARKKAEQKAPDRREPGLARKKASAEQATAGLLRKDWKESKDPETGMIEAEQKIERLTQEIIDSRVIIVETVTTFRRELRRELEVFRQWLRGVEEQVRLQARMDDNEDTQLNVPEPQDIKSCIRLGYKSDAEAIMLVDGIGVVVDYIKGEPTGQGISDILDSARDERIMEKTVKIQTSREMKEVLRQLGVKSSPDLQEGAVFSLLPRILVDSIGQRGGFGTDLLANKELTAVIRFNEAEFVLQKGGSRDGMRLQDRGAHISIIEDYPAEIRELARNYLSSR